MNFVKRHTLKQTMEHRWGLPQLTQEDYHRDIRPAYMEERLVYFYLATLHNVM